MASLQPVPPMFRRPLIAAALALATLSPAAAFELDGVKRVALHTSDGQTLEIGTVAFAPRDCKVGFKFDLDVARFKDFFLSMREFKCLEGKEIQCFVPYPYANPATITTDDLAWLETSLIFMYKTPAQFGATLANGLYYELKATPDGLVGAPRSIDLNQIAAPPDDPSQPPFPPAERLEIEDGARWVTSLSIR